MMTGREIALERLSAAYHDPHVAWKDGNAGERQVFGCLNENVPLELIHAAGIMPVHIQGGHETSLAAMHLQSFCCSYSRGALHRGLAGEYSYLTGIVSAKTCDVGLGLFDLWSDILDPGFKRLISLPGNRDEAAIEYLRIELQNFKADIEQFCGREITPHALSESIHLYNKIRENIKNLWNQRDAGSLKLSAREIASTIKACSVLPPEDSSSLLTDLLKEGSQGVSTGPKVRILLTGNTYADTSILDLIEGKDSIIVLDSTDSVGRYFGPLVELEDDPIHALARHYAGKVTGCYRLGFEERLKRIQEEIIVGKIDGCINLIQKYCDTSVFETNLLEESLRQSGIPVLRLEIDDSSPGSGQIKTRAEAFAEMIGELR